jgi:hypothetical protein
MRLRIFAVAAVVVLAYVAIQHRSAMPDPSALILNLRNQAPPIRFTLATEPEQPRCDTPVTLKVHAIDTAGHAANGLIIEADAAMNGMEHGALHVTLRSKGHGNYEGKMEMETAGSWDVDLSATKDMTTTRQRLSIEVGGAQTSPEKRNPNDDESSS